MTLLVSCSVSKTSFIILHSLLPKLLRNSQRQSRLIFSGSLVLPLQSRMVRIKSCGIISSALCHPYLIYMFTISKFSGTLLLLSDGNNHGYCIMHRSRGSGSVFIAFTLQTAEKNQKPRQISADTFCYLKVWWLLWTT